MNGKLENQGICKDYPKVDSLPHPTPIQIPLSPQSLSGIIFSSPLVSPSLQIHKSPLNSITFFKIYKGKHKDPRKKIIMWHSLYLKITQEQKEDIQNEIPKKKKRGEEGVWKEKKLNQKKKNQAPPPPRAKLHHLGNRSNLMRGKKDRKLNIHLQFSI